jgi:PAS domain S-box-containing protein
VNAKRERRPTIQNIATDSGNDESIRRWANDLFADQQQVIFKHTDRMFAVLMIVQWIAGIAAALWISPKTWTGQYSQTHIHVWAAVFLGGAISIFPIILILTRSGYSSTRYVIAIAQMLMSALLIHLTGGRIETHFHVFGSLAFLSFYRDWRVLVPATLVVAADHILRGVFWPQSVYGVLAASNWRWLEHAGWVLFENTFLYLAIRQSVSDMWNNAQRMAQIKSLNQGLKRHTTQVAATNRELKDEINERKRTEEALRRAEEKYRGIFENAGEGIYQSTPGGRFISVNPKMARMYGYTSAEEMIADQTDIERRHYVEPARRVEFKKLLEEQSFVQGFESEVYRKDRSSFWVSERVRAVRDKDGTLLYYEGTIEDITERNRTEEALRESEERLRQSQKMEGIGQLAGGMAHDFNNILTAITGYSDLTLRKLPEDNPLRHNVEQIKKAGERAASLTRQLLAFSRKQILQPKVLNLNAVVPDMDKMLRRLISEDIDLLMVLDPALGSVKADPSQIEQVILNLFVNARDAMPKGGKLTIETSNVYLSEEYSRQYVSVRSGHHVMLAVSDNGCGIEEATKKRIFEPFFTTKGTGKGTGLGLSTVYGIVKQSEGSIWVYSEVGKGTTFKVYLPRCDEVVEEHKQTAPYIQLSREGEMVLLVEDEEMVRGMARQVLEMNGYHVLEASHGKEALRICEQHKGRIDLMVTDVVMPQMGGQELAECLASSRPETRVLFVSGYTDDAIVHHGVLNEGVNFLQKPFTPDALAHKVREVLSMHFS